MYTSTADEKSEPNLDIRERKYKNMKRTSMNQVTVRAGLLLASSLLMAMAAGATEAGQYNEESADTGFEQETDAEGNEILEVPERGLRYHVDRAYMDKGLYIDPYNQNLQDYPISTITFMGEEADRIIGEVLDLPEDQRTPEGDEAALEESWKHSGNLLTIVLVEDDEYKKLTDQGTTADDISGYADTKELGHNDGYTYLYARPEMDQSEFTDDEKAACAECSDYIDQILDTLEYTDVEMEATETEIGDSIPAFNTVDINGNPVSNDIFAQKDLTVINVWGTFCGPCIEELPELGAWAGELPENVQILGLVGDVEGPDDSEHLSLAAKICEKAGVSYTNVIPDKGLQELLKGVIGYPTTFVVDEAGNVIGEPIVGAYPDKYKEAVESALG